MGKVLVLKDNTIKVILSLEAEQIQILFENMQKDTYELNWHQYAYGVYLPHSVFLPTFSLEGKKRAVISIEKHKDKFKQTVIIKTI